MQINPVGFVKGAKSAKNTIVTVQGDVEESMPCRSLADVDWKLDDMF